MKLVFENKKRMNESMGSDDIVEFFKKFLRDNYTDYRDNHKNDRRFLSALKSDLEQLIDRAVTDFWFE